jgi:hypothetical protein
MNFIKTQKDAQKYTQEVYKRNTHNGESKKHSNSFFRSAVNLLSAQKSRFTPMSHSRTFVETAPA